MKKLFTSKLSKILSYIIFWSWNLIFLIFVLSIILPSIGVGIFQAFFSGEIPFDFFFLLIIGTSIPILSVILGLTKFKKEPKKLFRLFYGIEIPLGFILFLRLWLLKELTPGTWQILTLLVFGGAIYLYDLFSGKTRNSKTFDIIRFSGHTVLLLIAVYFGIIMLFYFIPLLSALIISFFSFEWINDIGFMIQAAFIAFFFILISGTILLILPIAMPTLYFKKFIEGVREFNKKYSTNFTLIISASVIIVNILLFINLNRQPQQEVFTLLKKENLTQTEKSQILEKEELIREGLLNSYLASYRYLTTKNDTGIKVWYKEVFSMGNNTASVIQNSYNAVIKPFVYDGESHWSEKQKADKLYAEFFDAPIQRSEIKTIKKALQATWDRDGIEAGLLNINDEKVHIIEQNINIDEKYGVAQIEICETYQNKTNEQQEIFYYFSLPENAVITGLWLSDDGTDKKYTYSVSPRGTAQQVYKNEVQRRVDPSLLEQTGPGQYRLRAFPIPAINSWDRNRLDFKAEEYDNKLKLWLRYVCISKDNNYPLPRLSEKRNVYWTDKTKITLNGKEINKHKGWLPKNITATTQFAYSKVNLENNATLIPSPMKDINLKEFNEKLALFIDQSYSMKGSILGLAENIEELKKLNKNIHILYFSDKKLKKVNINDFNLNELLFFGSSTYYEMLTKLKLNFKYDKYEQLIIVTDAGSYELNKNVAEAESWQRENDTINKQDEDERKSFDFEIPVNFLHLNYSFPQSYDDMVLETIEKSNGSVAGNIDDLLKKISANKIYNNNSTIADSYSGIKWSINENKTDIEESSNSYLKAIAAKQYIKILLKQNDTISLNILDRIHKIAKANSIVTPYSSMIILVNDRQKEALKKAEQAEDRFDRETETGIENMSGSTLGMINVTGTPEPEEWVLIIISALMLVFMYSKYLRK